VREDAELGDADRFSGGGERCAGGGDGVVGLSGSDGVVVLRIGVLGLVSPTAETVDRLQSVHSGKLRSHGVDDDDVAA